MKPRPLFGKAPASIEGEDQRDALAAWITSPQNHLFAQVMANRVWADLMTRGFVEPVDDMRATNPPTNGPLLTALGEHFRESGFSLTELVRVIANSQAYQLSSLPNDSNVSDTRNYSRHYRHRLRAEVLLDAVTQVTGMEPEFAAMPPCERTTDSTVVQSLHLMNSDKLYHDIGHDSGKARILANSEKTAPEVSSELYRLVFGREPTPAETALVTEQLAAEGAIRRQVIEDLTWAMVNSAEFVFQD